MSPLASEWIILAGTPLAALATCVLLRRAPAHSWRQVHVAIAVDGLFQAKIFIGNDKSP